MATGHFSNSVRFLDLGLVHYNFYDKYMWKKCPSSIRCRDSNPRPSERESLPITTRSELPPIHFFLPLFNKVALPVKLFGFRVEV